MNNKVFATVNKEIEKIDQKQHYKIIEKSNEGKHKCKYLQSLYYSLPQHPHPQKEVILLLSYNLCQQTLQSTYNQKAKDKIRFIDFLLEGTNSYVKPLDIMNSRNLRKKQYRRQSKECAITKQEQLKLLNNYLDDERNLRRELFSLLICDRNFKPIRFQPFPF